MFDAALHAVSEQGRLLVIAIAGGRNRTAKVNHQLLKNIEISDPQISDMAAHYAEQTIGKLLPFEVKAYPPEPATEAIATIQSRHASGRVVVAIREP